MPQHTVAQIGDPAPAVGRRIHWHWLLATSGLAFLSMAIHAAWVETPTVDEFAHVPAGAAYLKYRRFDLYSKNPPLLKAIMAAPLVIGGATVPEPDVPAHGWGPYQYGDQFMAANWSHYRTWFFSARLLVVVVSGLTGVLLFRLTRIWFDVRAAAIATSLFLLCPTVLGHGHLATVDVGCMFSIFWTMYVFWWSGKRSSWWSMVAVGAVWGIALLIKFTATLLLPVILIVIFRRRPRAWKRAGLDVACVVGAALFVINLAMGFDGSFKTLGKFEFDSRFARVVQNTLPSWVAAPMPEAYVYGFDAVKADTESAEFGGGYLFGKWSTKGRWYYYPIALAVKMPVPILIMLGLCPLLLRRNDLGSGDWLTVMLPLVVLGFFLTCLNDVNTGIRYLLPLYPYLFLLIGALWYRLNQRWGDVLAIASWVYVLVAGLMVHPGHLSYFNFAAGGLRHGHRLLADSNLDWGQDLYRVKLALKQIGHDGKIGLLYFGHVHPALYGIGYDLVSNRPVEGILAVSVNFVVGASYKAMASDGQIVPIESDHVRWLRDHEPVVRAGSIWIYDTR